MPPTNLPNVKHLVDKVIKADKKGGRTVELLMPFDHMGKTVTAVTFSPILFDHILRWRDGAWKSFLDFMYDMSDVEEDTFRMLRYADAQLCIETFTGMLPPEIRGDVIAQVVPQRIDPQEAIRAVAEAAELSHEAEYPPGASAAPPQEQPGGFDIDMPDDEAA